MSTTASASEPPPPWVIFPDLGPADPTTQGAVEAYVDLEWLPFWRDLPAPARSEYLDRWGANAAWREAVAMRYGDANFDMARDAEESAAWLMNHPPQQPATAMWRRWVRRK